MKRKHRDAMIAMGIKIAALERLLKNHGQAHMAQDLLPQFTELVKKVEKLEGQLNFKLNDGPIANHRKRIADIEIEIKDMREDYHAHFRGLRGDEIKTLIERTDVLVRDVDALQIRLSRAQDMIAECHPSGCIEIKKPTGRPKKAR